MKDNSFYFKWKSFLLGFFFGIVGVLITLFAQEERRDKIYSSVIGFFIGIFTAMLMLKYGVVSFPKS
jgi:uncharacterized membrane protein YjjP (DUF1212 family)